MMTRKKILLPSGGRPISKRSSSDLKLPVGKTVEKIGLGFGEGIVVQFEDGSFLDIVSEALDIYTAQTSPQEVNYYDAEGKLLETEQYAE